MEKRGTGLLWKTSPGIVLDRLQLMMPEKHTRGSVINHGAARPKPSSLPSVTTFPFSPELIPSSEATEEQMRKASRRVFSAKGWSFCCLCCLNSRTFARGFQFQRLMKRKLYDFVGLSRVHGIKFSKQSLFIYKQTRFFDNISELPQCLPKLQNMLHTSFWNKYPVPYVNSFRSGSSPQQGAKRGAQLA